MTGDGSARVFRDLYDGRPSILRAAEQIEACVAAYKDIEELGLAFRVGMISQSLYDYAEALRVAYERRIAKEAEEL